MFLPFFLWKQCQIWHLVWWLPAYTNRIIGQFSGLTSINAIHICWKLCASRAHIINCDLLSIFIRMLRLIIRFDTVPISVKYLLESVRIDSTDITGS